VGLDVVDEPIYLGTSTDTSVVTTEGNALFLLNHVLEESNGSSQRHTFDRVGGFPGVLEMNTEVGPAGLARFRGVIWLFGIATHFLQLTNKNNGNRLEIDWNKRN